MRGGTATSEDERLPELTDKIITDTVLASARFYCDPNDPNATLYIYEDGIWKGCNVAENFILKALGVMFSKYDNRNKMALQKTVDYVRSQAMQVTLEEKPPLWVLFGNGLLKMSDKLPLDKMTLELPDGKYKIFNKIPHNYNPSAQCPNWSKFLDETTKPNDRLFIQEWFGYNLITSYPEAAFLILIGSGQNGKTLLLQVLSEMLGQKNVTNISLADLTYDDYAPSELYQKLANISDDIGTETIRNAGMLRKASGNSPMRVQRKFGHGFDIVNYAKLNYACNEPPIIKDTSGATKARLNFIDFPHTFKKDPKGDEKQARDRDLIMKELRGEMEGIVYWAVQGLERLVKNNFKFTRSQSTEEAWKFYERRSNPVACFIEEAVEFTGDDEDVIEKELLFRAYKAWEKEAEIKRAYTRDRFFKDLKEQDITARQSKDYGMKRMYFGLRFNSNKVTGSGRFAAGEQSKLDNNEEIEEQEKKKGCYLVIDESAPFIDTCQYCQEKTLIEFWIDAKPGCSKCAALYRSKNEAEGRLIKA